jgi:ATP-dependent DNA helicase RecG
MRTAEDIFSILAELEQCRADDLEDQDLGFKQWDSQSRDKAVKTVVQMAVCMANGGGGTVVFGVAGKVKGRSQAILGIPPEIDVNLLKKAVYDQTDPKITPVFEVMTVPEGSGRLLLMQIYPGLPPYTDSAGRGTIRAGKECQPLTGTLRRKIAVETGETDYTAEIVSKADNRLLSAAALEILRFRARNERAPVDLFALSDMELLSVLGVLKGGNFTRAALLLAGSEEAIRDFIPGHNWNFLHMSSDTDYMNREERVSALPVSVQRIEELLVPFNPIATHKQGLFHFEYRTWPEIAIREALMNAFCHSELRFAGTVMVKLYPDRLEISNNGGFIAGITPENILHHQPAARNLLLVEALARLRLVNRGNLGISRMFSALLAEGKGTPQIREIGESVSVIFFKRDFNAEFRRFITEESNRGHDLGVDELLLLQYLLQHSEIDTDTAAALCQRGKSEIRERLSHMLNIGYLEHGGDLRSSYWCVSPALYDRLVRNALGETRRKIDWEAAKNRVLSIMIERSRRNENGLSNEEIRHITRFDRNQARHLIQQLMNENANLVKTGKRRWTRYEYLRKG